MFIAPLLVTFKHFCFDIKPFIEFDRSLGQWFLSYVYSLPIYIYIYSSIQYFQYQKLILDLIKDKLHINISTLLSFSDMWQK